MQIKNEYEQHISTLVQAKESEKYTEISWIWVDHHWEQWEMKLKNDTEIGVLKTKIEELRTSKENKRYLLESSWAKEKSSKSRVPSANANNSKSHWSVGKIWAPLYEINSKNTSNFESIKITSIE